ncbi:MAG: hypothetical protein KF829_11335 [Ferruginibacter sp.]|nr:hypothetical protein [Ferruginibacter sp.]
MKQSETITDELLKIAPGLIELQNKQVYSAPEGYFNSFSQFSLNKINESENTSTITLQQISSKLPYTVPEDYFDSFAQKVIIKTKKAKIIKGQFGYKIIKYAAAAVVIGLIGFFAFNALVANKYNQDNKVFADAQQIIKDNSFEQVLSDIPESDIISYLESNGSDVNTAIVATIVNKNEALPEPDAYLFDDNTLDNFLADYDTQLLN